MELLKPHEVAKMLTVHPDTLRVWRRDGKGPAYVRIEGRVLYMPQDVQAYIAAQRVEVAR